MPEQKVIPQAAFCDATIDFARMALNHPLPESLLYDPLVLETVHGNDSVDWNKKEFSKPKGWSAMLPKGIETNLHFKNFPDITNISYDMSVWDLYEDKDYVIISHNFNNYPDAFRVLEEGIGR